VSREDVEVVRAIHERWRRGDSARELFDPEIEWSTPHPVASAIRGREELLAFLRRYAGTWQDYRIELEEIRNVGEHRVLVLSSRSGRGKGSGVKHTCDRRGSGP
jgi:ketosteroid isomerase-like protein